MVCVLRACVLEHILEKDLKDIKSGRLKPQFLPADSPTIRPIIKQEYDRKRAIGFFNQVYDFLLIAKAKYLKQEDCDEHHKKFGTRLWKCAHFNLKKENVYFISLRFFCHRSRGILQGLDTHHLKNRRKIPDFYPIPRKSHLRKSTT